MFIDTYIKTEGKTDENIFTMMEIFTLNFTNMKVDANFISKEEIETMKELNIRVNNNWKKETILVLTAPTQTLWIKALTGHEGINNSNIKFYINKWNNNEYKYLMLFKSYPYEIVIERLKLNKSQIIYENEGATIYLRNGE